MSSGAPAAAPAVERFLRRARGRALVRDLLAAALISSAADVVLRLGPIAVGRQISRELPQLFEGIYLFVVLAVLAWRRQSVWRVAGRVDTRLGLKDRLTTFLDFRENTSVEKAFRDAQALETAATVAPIPQRRAVPLPWPLWFGPPALLSMLYLSYFAFFRPGDLPLPVGVVRRIAPRPGAPPPAMQSREPQRAPASPEGEPPKGVGDATQPNAASGGGSRPDPGRLPWELPPAEPAGRTPTTEPAGGPRSESAQPLQGEPARLFSTKVGAGLTPVAPDAQPGAAGSGSAGPPQQRQGRVAFSLVPTGSGDGRRGGGSRPGGGRAEGLEITVDFDALPSELRAYVSRYFETLARQGRGGAVDGS